MKQRLATILFFACLLAAISCAKPNSPQPTNTLTASEFLGAKWTTTAATCTLQDGTAVTLTGINLTGLYLSDVTFETAPLGVRQGTAVESDYGSLTWNFDAGLGNLVVYFDPADGTVYAHVVSIDAHKMVLSRTGNNPDLGGMYKTINQTLTR